MVEVLVERDFERAVQQFTRKCMQAGILRELRDRVGYLKPSEKRRLKEHPRFFNEGCKLIRCVKALYDLCGHGNSIGQRGGPIRTPQE